MRSKMRPHRPGKFWPWVRELIWEKAYELHAKDFYDSHEENITLPTRSELREDGYFYQAKLLVLRQINRENRGRVTHDDGFEPPTLEEWNARESKKGFDG